MTILRKYSLTMSGKVGENSLNLIMTGDRVLTGQGKLEKVREFEWSGKGQGKIFSGKVRENEKLVPHDVILSG